MATKNQVRKFMRSQLERWPDSDYDLGDGLVVNATQLAEAAAQEFDEDAWLDDPDHWVWEVALAEAERYERQSNPSGPTESELTKRLKF